MQSWFKDTRQALVLLQDVAQRIAVAQSQGFEVRAQSEDVGKWLEGLEQCLSIAAGVDGNSAKASVITRADVTRLGEYALILLADLNHWVSQSRISDVNPQLECMALSVADWTVRNGGEIETLEPIVKACTSLVNRLDNSSDLAEIVALMNAVSKNCASNLQSDVDKSDASRPWRILHWNLAIAATRTCDLDIMKQAFGRLLHALPEEARLFFQEGMREMERLDYPESVKVLMRGYFDRYSRPGMN